MSDHALTCAQGLCTVWLYRACQTLASRTGFSEFSLLHVKLLAQVWRALFQHKAVSNVHVWNLPYFMNPTGL